MKRTILLFAVLLAAGAALALDPPDRLGLSQREVIIGLNGSPVALGVAASVDGGAFSTCTNTATPFDAGLGDIVTYTCSENAYAQNGTCTTVATTSSEPVVLGTKAVTILQSTEMAVAFLQQDGGSALKCYVGHSK